MHGSGAQAQDTAKKTREVAGLSEEWGGPRGAPVSRGTAGLCLFPNLTGLEPCARPEIAIPG